MNPSLRCVEFVKGFEALRLFAYPDPASPLARNTPRMAARWGREPAAHVLGDLSADYAGMSGAPWTIGYGHTEGVEPDDQITEHQADVLLRHDIDFAWRSVQSVVHVPLEQGMCDALTSFVMNVGMGCEGRKDGFAVLKRGGPSTMLRKLNLGDYAGAREEFHHWNHGGGIEMPGLTRRRLGEYAMWGGTKVDFTNVQAGSATTAPAED